MIPELARGGDASHLKILLKRLCCHLSSNSHVIHYVIAKRKRSYDAAWEWSILRVGYVVSYYILCLNKFVPNYR